ncbi:uncharacterized protein LOC112271636 [Brachypodium distachyon]|uniref:uncharacterized protein LOC112271636 n=1 Tax=Brachypodium distachyon TaxID=15368 RepID=UPI000D0CCB6D|nr:uncharacterized protein LOC112271636 [Brachypodium distachyon]|eukprot:XP_024317127.1 uncharacterized protein LOC112271636 [Brachypodium distachyon]
MATQGFGAPGTRPEEDTCVIPFSYDIDRDMRKWETTAAIAWAINAPRRLDALDVDRAIRAEFRISHADIVVTPHHPKQFLVKFANKAHCDEVLARGRMTARGLTVRIRPYRPLEHAFAAAMAFKVHLCLEKVPAFAWTPRIVERVIGRRCSFDRLDRRSAFMEQTDTLDLWAWMTNPSLIPKVMWVTFMGARLMNAPMKSSSPTTGRRGSSGVPPTVSSSPLTPMKTTPPPPSTTTPAPASHPSSSPASPPSPA